MFAKICSCLGRIPFDRHLCVLVYTGLHRRWHRSLLSSIGRNTPTTNKDLRGPWSTSPRPANRPPGAQIPSSALKDGAVTSLPKPRTDYNEPLVREIVKFFQTGRAPVANEETLETFAFMDAAQRSKEAGGKPMRLR